MPKRPASASLSRGRSSTRRRLNFTPMTPSSVVKSAGKTVLKSIPAVRTATRAYSLARSLSRALSSRPTNAGKGSADNSKSMGRFKSYKPKLTKLDIAARQGFVSRREVGDVVSDASNQVVYVAHSTMPQRLVERTLFKSLIKRLMQEAGVAIKNENVSLLGTQYYNSLIRLEYKVKDGAVVAVKEWTLTSASTLLSVADDMYNTFNGWAGTANLPQQLLRISFFVDFSGVISSAYMLQSTLDLTSARVQIVARSELKVQNRTLNSTGNNQSDNVDNVPIDGKFFEYKTNSTIYRDYATPAASNKQGISTSPDYGTLPKLPVDPTGTSMYDKIPLTSQFIGVKKEGSAHLDPGEIKTSVMTDQTTMTISKLIYLLYARSSAGLSTGIQQCWIGKTRLFAYEKMINAVAMSETNQFNLAYEHMVEIGVVLKTLKNFHTAPSTSTIIAQ